MFLFYVLSFFKKGDNILGGTLFKEIRYLPSKEIFESELGLVWIYNRIYFRSLSSEPPDYLSA